MPSAAKRNRIPFWERILFFAAVLMLSAAAAKWSRDTDLFPVREITVENQDGGGFRYIEKAALEAAAQESIGSNFLKVNLNRVQRRFEDLPWVARAEVSRVIPDKVVVVLHERRPVAFWHDINNPDGNNPAAFRKAAGTEILLDESGTVFSAPFQGALPHFYGPDYGAADMVGIYRLAAPLLAQQGLQVQTLRLSGRLAWQMELTNGITVKLGRDDTAARLRRFVQFWPKVLQQQAETLRDVDMRYANGFTVTHR